MRLGPYEIVAQLGAGGMGEVYRARDTRLGREVAIKVLPESKARDKEALARFEQEARSASALNHPNIVTIYDIGRTASGEDPISYMAMELVEGRSLRQIISEGAPAVEQIVNIARQVAQALAEAHAKAIVHRDLKPENIMVMESGSGNSGTVKILDFGLAKLGAPNLTDEHSTVTALAGPVTGAGVILGTVGYMSPEQASGRPADFRSDQFSLGAILYEMATGVRAFRHSTSVETLAAIIREEPKSVSQLNPQIPLPLQWAIKRCLAKLPEDRYGSTRDLARDLAIVQEHLRTAFSETPVATAHNLPVQRTPLIGRESELSAVKGLLLRQEIRQVTLTGPAGTGKTRLALQVAQDVLEQFKGGVYFVPLAMISDSGLVIPSIAQALGVRQTGGKPILEDLKEHLQRAHRSPTLLILDNFEQLLSAAPLVAELLQASTTCKILVTSRSQLRVYGEHEFSVPPLSLPDLSEGADLEALKQSPAVSLFYQRAAALKPDFALTSDNVRAVADICARLDGLPLAIELAASRIKLLPPAAILARLQSRMQLLTSGSRDLPERQQTLRAALDWSFDLLEAEEQKLFRRLSVFVSGCSLEAAEAVCNARSDVEADLLDSMASLVDKSLLQQTEQADGEARFRMLETIREYAYEHLVSSSEDKATQRAHAAYYLVLAEEGGVQVLGPDRQAWLNRFDLEQDNSRAALGWLTKTGNVEWGLRLGTALHLYWQSHGHPAEGRDRLLALLNMPSKEGVVEARTRAKALQALSGLALEQTDLESARNFLDQALEIYRDLGDRAGMAIILNSKAVVARDLGDYATARSLFEETIKLWLEIGDHASVAHVKINLADVVRAEGDRHLAVSLLKECQSIFGQLGDRTSVAWSVNHQGDMMREDDATAARLLYEQALEMFRELEDKLGSARCLTDLGTLAGNQGAYVEARRLYGEALKIFSELGETRDITRVLELIACATGDQEYWELTLRLAGAAGNLRDRFETPLSPSAKANLDRRLEAARRHLTTNAATAAWMEGSRMTPHEAVECALAEQAG
jgi:predicted ATPase/serine/threonine protein kinase